MSAPHPTLLRRGGLGPLVILGVALAAAVGAGLTVLLAGDALAALGLPDPGLLTLAGLPLVRVLAECAAVVAVGSLLLASFLVPPQPSGYLDVGGYAALRTARVAALGWALAAAAMVPLSAADAVGRPVVDVLDRAVLADLVPRLAQTGAWALTAGIAVLVAAGCWAVLSWGATVGLFALATVGLLPVALTGHSSAGGAHDVATNSLLYHLVAAAFWVGGLVAVLAHLSRRSPHGGVAVSRFSRLALVCWTVMALSGVINALIRVTPTELVTTSYGALLLGKIAALIALGAFGAAHRGRAVAAVVERDDRSSLLRLGGVEVLLMFATIGLAVALGRTPPPSAGVLDPPTLTEVLIGYDLAGAPTAARLLLDWRFDLVYGVLALVLAVLYLAGVRRLHRRGDAWPMGRTIAWLAGCATILVATSSGIGRYSSAVFSVHMAGHMLLSMLAPVLLVLGGPVLLALRALPAAGDGPPGPREWLLAVVHSGFVRALTHPAVVLVLFVGSFYAIYFTGLFDAAVPSHWAHLAMNAHFLLVGYAFYWPIIGIDPAPRQLPHLGKLGLLIASMPFHAFFGIALMSSNEVVGGDFYRALSLPFVPDLLADQRLAGGMAWASGEIPLVVVLVALLVQWARADERDARRTDRRADVDGDADLAAYNAMLAQLSNRNPT